MEQRLDARKAAPGAYRVMLDLESAVRSSGIAFRAPAGHYHPLRHREAVTT